MHNPDLTQQFYYEIQTHRCFLGQSQRQSLQQLHNVGSDTANECKKWVLYFQDDKANIFHSALTPAPY